MLSVYIMCWGFFKKEAFYLYVLKTSLCCLCFKWKKNNAFFFSTINYVTINKMINCPSAVCVCVMGFFLEGGGVKASRDRPILMIPSVVHLWQPGPVICQVGRTRASVREWDKRRSSSVKRGTFFFLCSAVRPKSIVWRKTFEFRRKEKERKYRQNDDPGGDHGALW